jgi:hypothetical protein
MNTLQVVSCELVKVGIQPRKILTLALYMWKALSLWEAREAFPLLP